MNNDEKNTMAEGVVALVAVLLAPVFMFWLSPMIVCDLWRWFAVPIGVHAIGHWQAFGLVLLVSCVRNSPTRQLVASVAKKTVGTHEISKSVLAVYVVDLALWGLGYLAS